MKQTKILTLITAIVAVATTSVYAKLPSNTILIGKDAFNVNYLFDTSHAEEVNDKLINAMNEGKEIFCINEKGLIKNVFDDVKNLTEEELKYKVGTSINYKSGTSFNSQKYLFANNEYLLQSGNTVINLEVSSNKIFSGKNVTIIKYKDMLNADVLDGNPYKLGVSGTDLKCNLNDPNPMMYYFSTSKKLPIVLYDQNDNVLAKGQADFSKLKLGQTISISCNLTKKDAVAFIEDNTGNSQNSGEVFAYCGCIYYSNTTDNKKLYSINTDGSENNAINEEMTASICVKKVQNDDWIYYSNLSDGGKLYKIKKDGTGRTKISDCKIGSTATANNEGNPYIYFTNASDNNKIYAINTTNDTVEKICDNSAESINVVDNEVYYNNTEDLAKLYKYSNGKSELVEQYKDKSGIKRFIGNDQNNFFICTFGGEVYKGNRKIDLALYNKSGNKSKPDKASNINVVGNYIYYKSLNDNGKLYRVGLEGGIAEPVVSSPVDNIYAVDSDNLYYSKAGKVTKLNVTLDDSGKVKFVSEQLKKQNTGSNSNILKIDDSKLKLDVTDINAKLSDEEKKMPETVFVTFKDYSVKNIPVYWDLNKVKFIENARVYTGTLVGYGTKVNFTLSMPSTTPPVDTTNITMDASSKKTAMNIEGLDEGDTIKVYADKENNKDSAVLVGKGIATSKKVALISNLSIPEDTKNIYITRAGKGKKESEKVKISNSLLKVPEIIDVKDMDDKIIGLDGRDLTIEGNFNYFDNKYIYILPKGMFSNIGSGTLNPYDLSDKNLFTREESSNKYTGTANITKDSLGKKLSNGNYDICVVGEKKEGNKVDKYISNIKTAFLSEEASKANFSVEVKPVSKFTNGIAPEEGISATISGVDMNANKVDSTTNLSNVKVTVNGLTSDPKLNEGDYSISNNVITLKKSYLNNLKSGLKIVWIENKEIGLSKNFTLDVVADQSGITSKVQDYSKFKVGSPQSDETVRVNIEEKLKDGTVLIPNKEDVEIGCERIGITKLGSSAYELEKGDGKYTIILKTELLKSLRYGENKISIKDTKNALNTEVSIYVESAASLDVVSKDGNRIEVNKIYPDDVKLTLNRKDENGGEVKTDLSKLQIKIGQGNVSNTCYTIENNTVTLKKEWLKNLPSGTSKIDFYLDGLKGSINVDIR